MGGRRKPLCTIPLTQVLSWKLGHQDIRIRRLILTKAYLSLKDVLVHCSGGAFFLLVSKKTRSIEELLTLFLFCKDSFHAEVFHKVVVAWEPLNINQL